MRGVRVFVVASMVGLGVACNDDDQGPGEPALDIEKPTTKNGDQQTGPVSTALGNPLRVLITRDGEPAEGVDVDWSTGQGGSLSDEQQSGQDGIASVVWTLGPEVGQHTATASLEGADGSPLTYTATATIGGGPPPGPTVLVRDNLFDPATISISVGQTVTWTWAPDAVAPHNVLPDDRATPGRSGEPEVGPKTYSFTFNTIGAYRYYCQVHGGLNGVGMAGRVVVGSAQP